MLALALVAAPSALHADTARDPLLPYLDDKPPTIVREIAGPIVNPHGDVPLLEGVTVRQVVFSSRNDSEIYALIATPNTPGKHPGMLVLHGGGGSSEQLKAMYWAQRGYTVVAPDLPGISSPVLPVSHGTWSSLKYGDGRWVADPDASQSVIFDAVLSGMKSLYLLRSLPDVDKSRVGVVGISWGGYMTTMICGLAGDKVKAGFAIYGCGFFDLSGQPALAKLPEDKRQMWMNTLDAGRRAPKMKAAYFLASATNDFFGWPQAGQATIDAIPGNKNHVFAANDNHHANVPGGTVFETAPSAPFVPTPFQPFPTPTGAKANWLAMEVPYFEYHLKGIGQPFPIVTVEKATDLRAFRFRVASTRPITKATVYWAAPDHDVLKRVWTPVPATKASDGSYTADIPANATDWYALVSDDRPVSVSSNMVHVDP
jgi:dienelactone hydrolase